MEHHSKRACNHSFVRNAVETRYLNTSRHPAAPRGTVEDSPSPPPAQVNTSVTLFRGSTALPVPVPGEGSKIALRLVEMLQNKRGAKRFPCVPLKQQARKGVGDSSGFHGMLCVERGH